MSKNKELEIKVPTKMLPLFTNTKRYAVIYGGRSSSKSWSVGVYVILRAYKSKIRILCCREFQVSISKSSRQLLVDTINRMGLSSFFKITDNSIKGDNGSEIIFTGLYNNLDSVKSTENIDLCWIEESQSVSRRSIEVLTPTVRAIGSQLIFTLNREHEEDVITADFINKERDDTLKIEINYTDNPFCPQVMIDEANLCMESSTDDYNHIWLGQCVKHSDAQVFKNKWYIKDFILPDDTHYYYGMDLGMSQDPTAVVKTAVVDKDLYIVDGIQQLGIEITNLKLLFEQMNINKNDLINIDCSRPETISHLKNVDGYNAVGYGKLGIEDGIEYMRSFEHIYIKPELTDIINEFRQYSYKIDQRSGQITDTIVDKHNHNIDAIRYSLYDCIKRKDAYVSIIRY